MLGWLSRNFLVDLGSYKTAIYSVDEGIVYNEPTCIVFRKEKGKENPVNYGLEALQCLGRTPENMEVVFPVRNGVIVNFKAAQIYLRKIFNKLGKTFLFPHANRIYVVVPSFLSDVEKRTFSDLFGEFGKTVKLIPSSLVNCVGFWNQGNGSSVTLIVDIGGGKTEIAVLSSTDVVFISSIRVGGSSLNEAIVNFVKREFLFQIGELTAEQVKKNTLSLVPDLDTVPVRVRGMNLESGLPATLTLTSEDLRYAVFDAVNLIRQGILMVLENSPPELAGEIVSTGINLCGGSAYVRGLALYLSRELQVKTQVVSNAHILSLTGLSRIFRQPELNSLVQ
ncbi:MAG: rod shape-determining protein [Deltaproteobacteria bacterium]|nr:rod shape-determining protein [Deltaproteobacteria bacterium]MCX7953524.1 rod shape-determining protein [Deltaproteobacteria bacterium]